MTSKKTWSITVLVLLILAANTTLVHAQDNGDSIWDSGEPGPQVGVQQVPYPCRGGESVLLIQDVVPWGPHPTQNPNGADVNELLAQGKSFCMILSSAIGTTNLLQFQEIIIASAQTQTFYNNLFPGRVIHTAIVAFVNAGGILSANLADWASGPGGGGNWDGMTFVGGVTKILRYTDDNNIRDFGHPVIADALACPGGNCARIVDTARYTDLDGWGLSSHGFFTNLPVCTRVIIVDESENPVMIEYAFGAGQVIATMTTIEWRYGNGVNPALPQNLKLLANDISYQDDPIEPSCPIGGAVASPSLTTMIMPLLPFLLLALVAVGAAAYAMRRRYASPILARIR